MSHEEEIIKKVARLNSRCLQKKHSITTVLIYVSAKLSLLVPTVLFITITVLQRSSTGTRVKVGNRVISAQVKTWSADSVSNAQNLVSLKKINKRKSHFLFEFTTYWFLFSPHFKFWESRWLFLTRRTNFLHSLFLTFSNVS